MHKVIFELLSLRLRETFAFGFGDFTDLTELLEMTQGLTRLSKTPLHAVHSGASRGRTRTWMRLRDTAFSYSGGTVSPQMHTLSGITRRNSSRTHLKDAGKGTTGCHSCSALRLSTFIRAGGSVRIVARVSP